MKKFCRFKCVTPRDFEVLDYYEPLLTPLETVYSLTYELTATAGLQSHLAQYN